MELPSHPAADDTGRDQGSPKRAEWVTVAIVTLVGALVVVLVILHLSGVAGPGGH